MKTLLVTLLMLAPFAMAQAPTPITCPVDWSAFECHFTQLQLASLDATRGEDFISVHVALDDTLMQTWYTWRLAGARAARKKLMLYDRKVARLVREGRVSMADAERLAAMSRAVRRLL